jgi:hypothetical protein
MFALGTVEILVLVLLALLIEAVLFWAASALADAPDLGWGRVFGVSLAASVACAAVGGAIAWSLQSVSLRAPENRLLAVAVALLALLVSWVIPGVLYAPLARVTIPRGMFISVLQVLLRVFLYVLIAAVVMVVLAVIQIFRGADVRTEVLAPVLSHAFLLLP